MRNTTQQTDIVTEPRRLDPRQLDTVESGLPDNNLTSHSKNAWKPTVIRFPTKNQETSLIALQRMEWDSDEPASPEYFEWHQRQNPEGSALTCLIEDDAMQAVTNHTFVPLPVLIKGKRTTAGLSLTGVTHPDYRRKGLNNLCSRAIYEETRKAGVKLVLSVPNTMSYSLLTLKQDFLELGKPLTLVRLINPSEFIGRHVSPLVGKVTGVFHNSWSKIFPTRQRPLDNVRSLDTLDGLKVEKIWENMDFVVAADADWLTWRYKQHPFGRYQYALAGERESPDVLVVYRIQESYKRAEIMEFFAAKDVQTSTVRDVFDFVAKKSIEERCSSLWSLATPQSRKARLLKKSGFWVVPFDLVWRPTIVARISDKDSLGFSLNNMDISYGSLINVH